MGHRVLTNVKTILDYLDISPDTSSVAIAHEQAEVDDTSYPSTATATAFKARLPGLQSGSISMVGGTNLADDQTEETVNSKMGIADTPIIIGPDGLDLADPAYFGVINEGQYQVGGAVGNRSEMQLSGLISQHQLIRGNVLLTPIAFTGTFNGTGQQLGAVLSSQCMYALLAVLAFTGTSCVLKLQSSSTQGGSYTTRITFTTVSGKTSQFATPVAGAITDTWWRIICDSFTGTTVTAVGVAGVR